MTRKTVKQKIFELLSDWEDRNIEEISKELDLGIASIKKVMYRDSKSDNPHFTVRFKKGKMFYYTVSSIFAKELKEKQIINLKTKIEKLEQTIVDSEQANEYFIAENKKLKKILKENNLEI